jgi:transitional endoplasmic reticulum ATPase
MNQKQHPHKNSKKESNRTPTKIKEFYETLKHSPLSDVDKKNIGSIIEYFQNKQDKTYASRIFFFFGDAGIGKTYLATKLLEAIDVEILYMACADFSFRHGMKCASFEDLIRKTNNKRKQVIFLDDLSYLFEKSSRDTVRSQDRRSLMQILNLCKSNINKVLIITTNDYGHIDMRMFDRIEVKIEFDLPNEQNKKMFLDHNFKDKLPHRLRAYIADNTVGYNYRDLTELVKLSYRLGENSLSRDSIKEALQQYEPTQLGPYDVQNCVDIKMKDIIGKVPVKQLIERVVHKYKNETLSNDLGLKRCNLLLFHGRPGTGKTFVAKAIAGELGFPLISVNAKDIHRGGSFYSLEAFTEMGKRYRNCVIFIDEAEKLFGNGRFEEDNPFLGEFHACLDGADGREIRSVFILAINDISRFGETLLDRFVRIKFELPEYEERVTFFQKKIDHVRRRHIKLMFTCDELAMKTDTMSYREMDRYWDDLMFQRIEPDDTRHPNGGFSQHHVQARLSDVMFG